MMETHVQYTNELRQKKGGQTDYYDILWNRNEKLMIAIQVILEMNFSLSSNDDAIVHSIFVTSRATFYSIPLPTPLPYHCFLAKTIDTIAIYI